MVDWGTVETILKSYATPIVGAALILGGIFLRLLGKGIAYLILALGSVGTVYVVWRGVGTTPDASWLPIGVLAAGIAASVALALALRALTVAVEFGLFTVGWYLLLQAGPAFLPTFPALSSVAGASTWMGITIATTAGSEWAGRRLTMSRRRGVITGAAASAARLVRR